MGRHFRNDPSKLCIKKDLRGGLSKIAFKGDL